MPNRALSSHAWITSALQIPSLQTLLSTGLSASSFFQEPSSDLANLLFFNLTGSSLPTAQSRHQTAFHLVLMALHPLDPA